MQMKLKKVSLKKVKSPILLALIFGVGLGIGYEEIVGIGTWHSYHQETDKVNICFTPPSGCGVLIAQQISKAKETIYVQAYGLTYKPIVDQLIKAKGRGVKIKVLLDKSNLTDRYSKMNELNKAGIDVAIDRVSGIAHNKVIIIDQSKVITGSFNFTKNAETKNAENVVLIEDEQIAKAYLKNWHDRKANSQN